MRHVAALPALAILAGSAAGLLFDRPPLLTASIVLTGCAVSAFWCWRLRDVRALAAFAAGAFFAGSLLLSAVAWQDAWRPTLRLAFEDLSREGRRAAAVEKRRLPLDDEVPAVIEGVLRGDAAVGTTGVSLDLAAERIAGIDAPQHSSRAARGGIQLLVVGELAAARVAEWRAGRRVRMPALLRRPSRYLDPGVPDHERALARRGTTLVGTVKSGALVEVVARAGRWTEALAASRAFARHAIAGAVGRWDGQSGAIVAAIVIGDRTALNDDVQRRLQEAGTYHVIAISGGNIAILAGLMVGAFRLAGWLGRTAMLTAIALLVAYAQLVGGGASVDRATLMAVVYFAARAFDQRSPPLNALAVVTALLVASDPLSVVDPAFLLTCGATIGILVVVPAFAVGRPAGRTFRTLRARVLEQAVAMFVASAAAEAVLLPVGAMLFSRVTFAGLALNFLAIPLMAVAQIAGMVVVPASLFSDRAAVVAGWAAHAGAQGLIWSANLVRFAPAVTWRVAPPTLATCAVYYASGVVAWVLWRRAGLRPGSEEDARHRAVRLAGALTAAVAALFIAFEPAGFVAARGDGRLHVTFIDVGQGDSAFVVFPRGATLLVDAGGLGFSSGFDVGDRVVAPAVRAAGFRRLDRFALTHGDPDHIGGALSIVREFHPRELWEGIPVPRSEPLAAIRDAATQLRAAWVNAYAPLRAHIEGVEVIAWHPLLEEWERQKVRNDDSLVLELRWGSVSVVLTGDIGGEPERRIAAAMAPAPIRVVKVPHHGSLTSSTAGFVEALHPRAAVVSVGRTNHFGHPVPEVLRRYESAGAEVFRTDRDGAVFLESDGASASLRTFSGREMALTAHHEGAKGTKDGKVGKDLP